MSILGHRVLRKEDPLFLTSGGSYVDDLRVGEVAHVTYVRSTVAHARLVSVDVRPALAAPGVLAVFTSVDVDLGLLAPPMSVLNSAMTRRLLALERVRFVGECLAAVVSETQAEGADAVERVVVEYEPMPAVVGVEAALSGEVLLFPDAGTNICLGRPFERPDDFFEGCEVVVRRRIVNQRVAPCPLEVRSAAAVWDGRDRVTCYVSTQNPHLERDTVARVLGMRPGCVRVVAPDVGGAFGAKGESYPEALLLGWIAKRVGRPVKWTETRSESMVALGHGRGQHQEIEIGGTRDGNVEAYRLTIVQDAGAYPMLGGVLPLMTRAMLPGVYAIPRLKCNAVSVVTNTTPVTSYRGAGRPEATAAIERAMDLYAAEIGMDPVEVRRRNLIGAFHFPYTTAIGTTYDCGDYAKVLDAALDVAGYAGLRIEQQRRRASGARLQLGIGVSIYVEITGAGSLSEFASIEVRRDGKAVIHTGTSPHGQGHVTAWAMLASEQTGIPMDDIDVVHGDTDRVSRGGGTSGSRSLQQGGMAVSQAATLLVDRARQLAAIMLEASPEDVVLDSTSGRFHVVGAPVVSRSWSDIAAVSNDLHGEPLGAETIFTAPAPTFPFGAHIAVVEVDVETGHARVTRLIAVDDAGRIINPVLAEGQIHGGLAQGLAQALLEGVSYDRDGNPRTTNLADYTFVSATELPSFETVQTETPTPVNVLGAKGIGESGTIGSTAAVQSAVIDAVSHLGVRHVDMPLTPERVWRALSSRGRG